MAKEDDPIDIIVKCFGDLVCVKCGKTYPYDTKRVVKGCDCDE